MLRFFSLFSFVLMFVSSALSSELVFKVETNHKKISISVSKQKNKYQVFRNVNKQELTFPISKNLFEKEMQKIIKLLPLETISSKSCVGNRLIILTDHDGNKRSIDYCGSVYDKNSYSEASDLIIEMAQIAFMDSQLNTVSN